MARAPNKPDQQLHKLNKWHMTSDHRKNLHTHKEQRRTKELLSEKTARAGKARKKKVSSEVNKEKKGLKKGETGLYGSGREKLEMQQNLMAK